MRTVRPVLVRSGRKISLSFLACLLAVTVPAAGAEAREKCRNAGSEARPVPFEPAVQIRSGTGTFRFRKAQWVTCTKYGSVDKGIGLTDESGKRVLVPARYEIVVPINDTTALVGPGGLERYNFYRYGVGETGPSPYYHAQLVSEGNVATPIAWSTAMHSDTRTLYVFEGSAEPVAVPGVTELTRMDSLSRNHILNFKSETGEPLSRILDPVMRPLSPAIGRVEVWKTFPVDFSFNGPTTHFPRDLVSQSMRFQHPSLPYDGLYIPVAPDGTPLPLPAGAVGVFPLRRSHLPHGFQADETYGWAVVFPTREGFEIAPVHAPLAQALQQAPAAKRYTGMRRSSGVLMLREAAGWRPVTPTLEPVHYAAGNAVFADPDEGFLAIAQAWQEKVRSQILERTQREAALARARKAEGDAMWARVQSGTMPLCSASPSFLPPAGLERFFRECEVDRSVRERLGSQVTADALSIARQRSDAAAQALAAERARATQERFFGGAQSPGGDPWARGVAAAQAAADASYNSFLQRQNDIYQRNLSAWNSGAHNWRPTKY